MTPEVLYQNDSIQRSRISSDVTRWNGINELQAQFTHSDGPVTLTRVKLNKKPREFTITNQELDSLIAQREIWRAWQEYRTAIVTQARAILEDTESYYDENSDTTFNIWHYADPYNPATIFTDVPLDQLIDHCHRAVEQVKQAKSEETTITATLTATIGDC